MDNSTLYGLPSKQFLDLTWLLMGSRIFDEKLQVLETESWDYIMEEEITPSVELKQEAKIEDYEDPEENTKDKNDHITNSAPYSMVEFVNLQDVYEKIQSRAGGGSAQRISMGNVHITAISEGQLCSIDVYVQRQPEAALLCGDTNGKVPLRVTYEAHFQNQQTFSIDLDSVYNSSNGTPVYKLATVDSERRNLFILIVQVKFIDGTKSEPFVSKPFLIRSRKPRSRTQSADKA